MTQALDCQRDAFSLPTDGHYLNCAYMSPLLRVVEDAGISGLRRKRDPSVIGPDDFFQDAERIRCLFARLVNADPTRIAIMPAASYGVSTAVRNLAIQPGRRVVMAAEQFPGNVYGWRSAVARLGGAIDMVEPPESDHRGQAWTARILDAIGPDTAAVTLGNVHWTDGTRFDLGAIGRRAREVGAALVVDGTQSVGAMPFDVEEIRPDLLVCASYKWLLGPYSLALCYLGERFDGGEPLEETWIAREGSEDFKGLVDYVDEYQPGAARFDVGERSNFILLPMQIAALEQLLEWTPEGIQRYTAELSRDMLARAVDLGYAVEDPAWRSSHLFGIRMPPGLDLVAVKEALARRRISVSLRGQSLRVAPHLYNDEGDLRALSDVLKEVRR